MQLRCSLTLMTAATTLSPWICRNTSLGVSSKILWPAHVPFVSVVQKQRVLLLLIIIIKKKKPPLQLQCTKQLLPLCFVLSAARNTPEFSGDNQS